MTRVLPPVKREKKYNSVDFSAESICVPYILHEEEMIREFVESDSKE
jgi:hypothetical protein